MLNMLEPVEKIHALIDPAVRLPQHWGIGSVFRLPVSDTSCRNKRESLNPVCKAKRCRHSAALGLNDERRWVDLESVDNTTAGLENSNQLVQHNSEDSWQTDGAIFTDAMTHNGGIVAFGHFWCLLVWTKVNRVWHFFWSHMWWNLGANSLNSCCTSLCGISAQNPYWHTSHIPTRNSSAKNVNSAIIYTHFSVEHKRKICKYAQKETDMQINICQNNKRLLQFGYICW